MIFNALFTFLFAWAVSGPIPARQRLSHVRSWAGQGPMGLRERESMPFSGGE